MSEGQWKHQEHDFIGPDGEWIAVTVDEDGSVEVWYYDHRSVVVHHAVEDWTDEGRKKWMTRTRIAPGEPQPSIPAIE
ncbi:hypothetical protein [Kribbella jiaozuonensis]|uniref:Uncharacterized protein n=1 Tax=Kribbella jiaozuonensis TaxID=2575441 RepID=A0A4V5V084_9ACTN|nr:hypothetical protein [Kribbella jiaozuonensis]TKK79153.1 hypothetical protein FDA38_12030 [Kribbella jiaozuonensis]TKK83223.1 hypothetical protein FDA38_10985 [Kribbella jiaozuonensis]